MKGELVTMEMVWDGYVRGWFPMEEEETGDVGWFAPYQRAIFPIEGVHVSRSLARRIRRGEFEVTFDRAFDLVIENCRRPGDNWIGPTILSLYQRIHRMGLAHSVECWRDGVLVGGLYGVEVGACFSAESMFHRVTDASKVALWAAVNHARSLGFQIFDAQVMNPHLARMGAVEISQAEFLRRLHETFQLPTGSWVESPYS